MRRGRARGLLAAAVLVAGVAATAAAVASNDEGTLTGPQAQQASAAALQATGGGHVNAVERDNEKGATWEVEVTRRDGSVVDVRLDENFHVLVVDGDEGP